MSIPALDCVIELRRWVVWRTELRNGKPAKVPYSPVTGRLAKANDPETWTDHRTATAAVGRLVNGGGGGIGLMLGDLGNAEALGGIDLDTCRAADGEIDPWATEIIDRLATYAEISPSGTGVKMFLQYALSDLPELRQLMGTDYGKLWKRAGGDHPPSIELHLGNRYVAVTGQHLMSTPAVVQPVSLETLRWVIETAGPAFIRNKARNPPDLLSARTHDEPRGDADVMDIVVRVRAAAVSSPALTRRWSGDWYGLTDLSDSGKAMALGAALKRTGFDFESMCAALRIHPETCDWTEKKGELRDQRELHRVFDKVEVEAPQTPAWGEPDMSVMRLNRRPPPSLPLDVFGNAWAAWITTAAKAAGCPPDYVVAPLLASVSSLIGNARWAQATPGWCEPPHLWLGVVGDSGTGKSPGSDCLMRDVLPEIERRMLGDFPDRLREWRANVEMHAARQEQWKADIREAQKRGDAPPQPPAEAPPPEPQAPRLRQNDVTIEKVATLLASAAPKGLLIIRDELAGWLTGMNTYNDAGRQFWIEAYGGRPYRVERQKHPEPIDVPRLVVAAFGGTQPEKLAGLFANADDGLYSRFGWLWPEPLPFRLASDVPNAQWATDALDRLRQLDLAPGIVATNDGRPLHVPVPDGARHHLESFGQEMQERQIWAGGLMCSAYGKARGMALRLSLDLEFLWWAGRQGIEPPPETISEPALLAAMQFVADYLMPMAERVYGDAAASQVDRNAATLARWIVKARASEVYVRHLQREVRLPGLKKATDIHDAAGVLIEADWLRMPHAASRKRPREAYPVNPALEGATP